MNGYLVFNTVNFQLGIVTTILGFGVVFFVLLVICIMLYIFGAVMKSVNKKNIVTDNKPIEAAPVKKTEPVNKENLIDDKELVAVITAAIAASMGGNASPDKLVVRSLRRVKKSVWKTEAVQEQQDNTIM